MRRTVYVGLLVCALVAGDAAAADTWADNVVSYDPGGLDAGDYDDPLATLGEPSRTTAAWPEGDESVRMTVPPWQTTEVCKIGADGGELVVGFDEAVENDPLNPWGIDLLVFGNLGLASSDWPVNKIIGDPIWAFGGTVGQVSVSQDNVAYYSVAGLGTMFPMHAYLSDEADAYATGATPTDYTLPVNPALALDDFAGLTLMQALALYAGSGGGLGIDLSDLTDAGGGPVSLEWIRYVKIEGLTNSIDGFADVAVPEPATLGLVGIGGLAVLLGRRGKC